MDKIRTGNIIEEKENVEKCIMDRETMNSLVFVGMGYGR